MEIITGARRLLLRAVAWTAMGGLLIALPAASQWKDWDYDLDQEKKPWEELQAKLPPYPKTENLLKFAVGEATPHHYFVDSASVSVGDDGVVRYVLMIKTAGGATNVSFEGIRCEAREIRIYAFGRSNNEWSRARDSQWKRIEFRHASNHHLTLHREHFCPTGKHASPLKQIVQTLKYGPPRRTD